jgi:[acyl-carrier-protein] S-malonyltransferase
MSLAFFLGQKNITYDPAGMVAFHETEPAVRRVYEQAAEWTGMDEESLLRNLSRDEAEQSKVTSLGLAAAMIGIADLLAEMGVQPTALGGMSLGAMVSAGLAGSLSRKDLLTLIAHVERGPSRVEGERRQGIAAVVMPLGGDEDFYYGEKREGVWFGGDFGMHVSGAFRMQLVSGYRDALDQLQSELPEGYLIMSEEAVAAHSPLMKPTQDLIAERVAGIEFADPRLTLCSPLEQGLLTTAAQVREMFVRNAVEPVYTDRLSQEMVHRGAKCIVVLGPTLPRDGFEFPVPVAYVDNPADIAGLVQMMYENGVVA